MGRDAGLWPAGVCDLQTAHHHVEDTGAEEGHVQEMETAEDVLDFLWVFCGFGGRIVCGGSTCLEEAARGRDA